MIITNQPCADGQHQWQLRLGPEPEVCSICGATRPCDAPAPAPPPAVAPVPPRASSRTKSELEPPPPLEAPGVDHREWLRRNNNHPIDCPICGGSVKVYARSMTSRMARAIVEFYKVNRAIGNQFIHFPSYLRHVNQGDLGRDNGWLEQWGVIESMREDGAVRKGFWRITQRGIDFTEGRIELPESYLFLMDDCLGPNPEAKLGKKARIHIIDALETPFDYTEVHSPDVHPTGHMADFIWTPGWKKKDQTKPAPTGGDDQSPADYSPEK